MKIKQARYYLNNDGEQELRLLLSGNCEEECRQVEQKLDDGKEVNISFHSGKRSLDENSYYWLLVGKIAKAISASLNEVHNTMLRRYGVPMDVGGLVYAFIPDTDEGERSTLMSETYHLKPTSNVREGKNGTDYRAYIIMKGSSQLDTTEFARLIDGTISECEQMGIDARKPWER